MEQYYREFSIRTDGISRYLDCELRLLSDPAFTGAIKDSIFNVQAVDNQIAYLIFIFSRTMIFWRIFLII